MWAGVRPQDPRCSLIRQSSVLEGNTFVSNKQNHNTLRRYGKSEERERPSLEETVQDGKNSWLGFQHPESTRDLSSSRDPGSRVLHFQGLTSMFSCLAWSFWKVLCGGKIFKTAPFLWHLPSSSFGVTALLPSTRADQEEIGSRCSRLAQHLWPSRKRCLWQQ